MSQEDVTEQIARRTAHGHVSQTGVDAQIAAAVSGLYDDRGVYNASVNTFPASGGSGTAGAIKKGDIWTASAPGTLGGEVVDIGDGIRAVVDTPGQTAANWSINKAKGGGDEYFSILSDTFPGSAIDAGKWTTSGSVAVSGNKVRITGTGSAGGPNIGTVSKVLPNEFRLTYRMQASNNASSQISNFAQFQVAGFARYIQFVVSNSLIKVITKDDQAATVEHFSGAYNGNTYFRIISKAGRMIFQTSANKTTWTTVYTLNYAYWLKQTADLYTLIFSSYDAGSGTPEYIDISEVDLEGIS